MSRSAHDIYFHISPARNHRAIKKRGLLVDHAAGAMEVVWLCELTKVIKFFAHVCSHKHTWNLNIYPVFFTKPKYFHLHNTYYSDKDIPVGNLDTPIHVTWKPITNKAEVERIKKIADHHEHGHLCPHCDKHGTALAWGNQQNILYAYCPHCKRYNRPTLTLLED